MFTLDPYRTHIMPAHFGPLSFGPKNSGWYRDVTMMVVTYLTDREKLAACLPSSIEVADEALITIAYARNRDVDWLAGRGYNLISVNASVVFNGDKGPIPGSYTLVMWENLTDPIISGREMTGIPKIYADIPDHDISEGRWQCQASHFGSRILDLSIGGLNAATEDEIAAGLEAQKGTENPIGWRYLPAVGGMGTRLNELTLYPSDIYYKEVSVGEGTVDWNHLSWEQNPTQYHIVNALADLPILEYRPALVTRGSANLFVPERPSRVLWSADTESVATAADTTIDEIKSVCFVGAGTMGCYNSLVAAISGYDAVIYDISPEGLQKVASTHREMAAFLVGSGVCSPEAIPLALDRITTTADLKAATANADLVSESVFEGLDLKREIHQQLDKLCPDKTILTTNTSSLVVSEIEDVVQRGDRFAALHSYMGSRLVDIVAGPRTTPGTIDILNRYAESLSLVPVILKKENPGYVMNALLGSVLMTASALVVEGFASVEEVDRAYMRKLKAPMGPFGVMDMIGLGLVSSQTDKSGGNAERQELQARIASYLRSFVERGDLGWKSGKGFYTYPAPAYQAADFLNYTDDDSVIFHALVTALIRSAVLIADKGVADHADIDRTWMVATSQEVGPFGLLDMIGVDDFLAISRNVQERLHMHLTKDSEIVEAYFKQN